MADFLDYAVVALLSAVAAVVCLLPLIAFAVIRRVDARAAAKRAQQESAPTPIDTEETNP